MPLPVFDTQDAIPDAFRGEYEEKEGKWHPKVPDVSKLNSALQKERDRAADEERARKAAERERDELKREKNATERGLTKEQVEALRLEDAEKRKAELAPVLAENAKLKEGIRNGEIKDQLLAAGVMPTRLEKALLLLTPHLGEDGVVKDKHGKVITTPLDEFIETDFKADNLFVFAGTGSSGSSALGSDGSADVPVVPADPGYQARRAEQVARNF